MRGHDLSGFDGITIIILIKTNSPATHSSYLVLVLQLSLSFVLIYMQMFCYWTQFRISHEFLEVMGPQQIT